MRKVEDSFLSDILHYSCYNIVVEKGDDLNAIGNFMSWDRMKPERSLYTLKFSRDQFSKYGKIATSFGFEFITMNLLYRHDFDCGRSFYHMLNVNGCETVKRQYPYPDYDDMMDIMNIARGSFIYDRFHSDKNITKGQADMVKVCWSYNCLLGKRGDALFVYRTNGRIMGFLSSCVQDDIALIDLVAVSPNYRGQGIGTLLVNKFLYEYSYCPSVVVGTQYNNVMSILLYMRRAFYAVPDYVQYVYHLHLGV